MVDKKSGGSIKAPLKRGHRQVAIRRDHDAPLVPLIPPRAENRLQDPAALVSVSGRYETEILLTSVLELEIQCDIGNAPPWRGPFGAHAIARAALAYGRFVECFLARAPGEEWREERWMFFGEDTPPSPDGRILRLGVLFLARLMTSRLAHDGRLFVGGSKTSPPSRCSSWHEAVLHHCGLLCSDLTLSLWVGGLLVDEKGTQIDPLAATAGNRYCGLLRSVLGMRSIDGSAVIEHLHSVIGRSTIEHIRSLGHPRDVLRELRIELNAARSAWHLEQMATQRRHVSGSRVPYRIAQLGAPEFGLPPTPPSTLHRWVSNPDNEGLLGLDPRFAKQRKWTKQMLLVSGLLELHADVARGQPLPAGASNSGRSPDGNP